MPIAPFLVKLLGQSESVHQQVAQFRLDTQDPKETNYQFAIRLRGFKLRTYYKHLPTQTETQIDL